jgi:Tfp pilus assembly protein PilV
MMIEALVAVAIILGGGLATVAAFDSTTRASHTAEREAEAVSIAEKELERIVTKPFAQINDCVLPDSGTGFANDPKSWVQGTKLFVARNFRPTGAFATAPPVDVGASNQLALAPIAT